MKIIRLTDNYIFVRHWFKWYALRSPYTKATKPPLYIAQPKAKSIEQIKRSIEKSQNKKHT